MMKISENECLSTIYGKYVFRFIPFCFLLTFVLGCGQDEYNEIYRVQDYAASALSNDLALYESGIDGLVNEMDYHSSALIQTRSVKATAALVRIEAIDELGNFAANNNHGARDILLAKAVPALLRAYKNEKDSIVRPSIIDALSTIRPKNEYVIPIYLESVEKGWKCRTESLLGIYALKEIDYNLAEYATKIIEDVKSGETYRIEYGLDALAAMGRHAYGVIQILIRMRDDDFIIKSGYLDDLNWTIDKIVKDYKGYYEANAEENDNKK